MLSIIFDISTYFYGDSSNMPMIRGIIIYGYVFFIINKFLHYKQAALNLSIILLLLYWLILIPFSSKPIVSLNFYSKAVFPFIILFIVNNSNSTIRDFKYFFISFSFIILASILFFFIVNLLGINNESYVNSEVTSYIYTGLSDGKLYAQAVAISIFPFIWYNFKLSKRQKLVFFLVLISCLIYSIISVRRTTLIIIFLSITQFYFFSKKINKILKIIPTVVIILFVSSYFWLPILESRLKLRESRFSATYDIEEEARWKEIPFVIDEIFLSSDIKLMLFGKEFLNSSGNYANGIFGDRRLHIDYMGILHGSGLVGLFFYFIVYLSIYRWFNKMYKTNKTLTKSQLLDYKGLFYALLFTSLFISLSGQMYEVTFRTMIFFVLGISISNLRNDYNSIVI